MEATRQVKRILCRVYKTVRPIESAYHRPPSLLES